MEKKRKRNPTAYPQNLGSASITLARILNPLHTPRASAVKSKDPPAEKRIKQADASEHKTPVAKAKKTSTTTSAQALTKKLEISLESTSKEKAKHPHLISHKSNILGIKSAKVN